MIVKLKNGKELIVGLEVLINGVWQKYNFKSDSINFPNHYPNLKLNYVGQSQTYKVDGVICQDKTPHHYWKQSN